MKYFLQTLCFVICAYSPGWAQDGVVAFAENSGKSLLAGKKENKGTQLGIKLDVPSLSLRQQLALPEGVGFVVTRVDSHGAAAEAGLREHDVLVKLDDQWLINGYQLAVLLKMRQPGDVASLSLYRSGKMIQKSVILRAATEVKRPQNSKSEPDMTNLLRQSPLPVRVTDSSERSAAVFDGKRTGTLRRVDGRLHLIVEDLQGNVVYESSVETVKEKTQVPPPYAEWLPILSKALEEYRPRRRPRVIRPRRPKTPSVTK